MITFKIDILFKRIIHRSIKILIFLFKILHGKKILVLLKIFEERFKKFYIKDSFAL